VSNIDLGVVLSLGRLALDERRQFFREPVIGSNPATFTTHRRYHGVPVRIGHVPENDKSDRQSRISFLDEEPECEARCQYEILGFRLQHLERVVVELFPFDGRWAVRLHLPEFVFQFLELHGVAEFFLGVRSFQIGAAYAGSRIIKCCQRLFVGHHGTPE